MAVSDSLERLGPYVSQLAANDYAHEQLADAAKNLRAAYARVSSRKAAQAADDKKLYRQVRRGIGSLTEAAEAVISGRKKPKRRWPKRVVAVLGIAGGAALAREALQRDTPAPTA